MLNTEAQMFGHGMHTQAVYEFIHYVNKSINEVCLSYTLHKTLTSFKRG